MLTQHTDTSMCQNHSIKSIDQFPRHLGSMCILAREVNVELMAGEYRHVRITSQSQARNRVRHQTSIHISVRASCNQSVFPTKAFLSRYADQPDPSGFPRSFERLRHADDCSDGHQSREIVVARMVDARLSVVLGVENNHATTLTPTGYESVLHFIGAIGNHVVVIDRRTNSTSVLFDCGSSSGTISHCWSRQYVHHRLNIFVHVMAKKTVFEMDGFCYVCYMIIDMRLARPWLLLQGSIPCCTQEHILLYIPCSMVE